MTTSLDEVMYKHGKNMLFVQFSPIDFDERHREAHFKWFEQNQLKYESAPFRGLPNTANICYVVYFDDDADARISEYTKTFEDDEGRSRHPAQYQMVLVEYADWLRSGGKNYINAREAT